MLADETVKSEADFSFSVDLRRERSQLFNPIPEIGSAGGNALFGSAICAGNGAMRRLIRVDRSRLGRLLVGVLWVDPFSGAQIVA